MFTSGAVGAGAAELAVEGDVGAGEGAEGELACGKVDAKAAIGRVTEFNVEVQLAWGVGKEAAGW